MFLGNFTTIFEKRMKFVFFPLAVATQRQCHSALEVTLSWFCALQLEERLNSDLGTPLQGEGFLVKNLDCFSLIIYIGFQPPRKLKSGKKFKISDPSQSLVPAEEAPPRRFAHLNDKFYNQLGLSPLSPLPDKHITMSWSALMVFASSMAPKTA